MIGSPEKRQLDIPLPIISFNGRRDLGSAMFVEMLIFELRQDLLGPFIDLQWHACQTCDVNAVALVCGTGDDFMQKHDLIIPLFHRHVEVTNTSQRRLQIGQFMVVSGE